MGEYLQQMFGPSKLYIDNKPVGVATGPVQLRISAEDTEPENGLWEDKGFGGYDFSCTFQIDCASDKSELYMWLKHENERFRKIRKTMLWAVTHSYFVEIKAQTDNKEDVWLGFDRPSQVRRFFKHCGFLPEFRIINNQGIIVKTKKVCTRN